MKHSHSDTIWLQRISSIFTVCAFVMFNRSNHVEIYKHKKYFDSLLSWVNQYITLLHSERLAVLSAIGLVPLSLDRTILDVKINLRAPQKVKTKYVSSKFKIISKLLSCLRLAEERHMGCFSSVIVVSISVNFC